MNITVYISLFSLLVAGIALIRTFIIDGKKIINSRKALIRARVYQQDKSWTVKIWNEGQSAAKNIRIESEDIEKDECIHLSIEKGQFPYPLLNQDDCFELRATLTIGNRNPVPRIKFIWDDEYKKDNEREQVLSF